MTSNERHKKFPTNEEHINIEQCPMILVQQLFGGKWKLIILWYLSSNTMRFSELQRILPSITRKMLTQQLRSLEEDSLIHREVYPVVPPKVEYSLSNKGKKIIPILELMYEFGSDYISENDLMLTK